MRQALELAREALQMLHDENMDYLTRNKLGGENNQCMVFARETITAIKEALAQPEQEPVAWADHGVVNWIADKQFKHAALLYEAPQRTWVGLTDEEIADCAEKMEASDPTDSFWREFFRGIEAKLKEKNF